MSGRSFKNLVAIAVVVATVPPFTQGLAQEPPAAIAPSDCSRLMALHIDKQANPRAGRLSVACSDTPAPYAPAEAPLADAGVLFQYTPPLALVHSHDPAVHEALLTGNSLLTRMEGEWWIGFHSQNFSQE